MASAAFSEKGHRVSKLQPLPNLSLSPWNTKSFCESTQIKNISKINQSLIPEANMQEEMSIDDFVNNLPEVKSYRNQLTTNKKIERQLESFKGIGTPVTARNGSAKVVETPRSRSFRKSKKKAMTQCNSKNMIQNCERNKKILMNFEKGERRPVTKEKRSYQNTSLTMSQDINKILHSETQQLLSVIRNAKMQKISSTDRIPLAETQNKIQNSAFSSLDLGSTPGLKQTQKAGKERSVDKKQNKQCPLDQKLAETGISKLKQRNSSKVLIQNLLIKRNGNNLTKNAKNVINWCATMEATNTLISKESGNRAASISTGRAAIGLGKGRTTAQRMLTLRSILA